MGFEGFEFRTHTSRVSLQLPNGVEKLIEILPGLAYGSGNRPSTRLCIKVIERIFKERKIKNVLDVGCGSGILAICSAALGASIALALDVEPVVTIEAKKNIIKNGFSSKIKVICGSLESVSGAFDLVIANIVTHEILRISEELKAKLKTEGLLLVSGIYNIRKQEITYRFWELGLFLEKEWSEAEWVALLFKQT